MARQLCFRRWSAENRTQRRVGPLSRHARIEHEQRRTVLPGVPFDGRSRSVDDVRRRSHQHVDEFHEPEAVVAGHRHGAPRHPGQPRAGRDEQRGARRRGAFRQQLPGGFGDELRTQTAGDLPSPLPCDAKGPVATARSTASRWVSAPRGSGSACASWSSAATRVGSSHHPGDRARRCSDDAEAGVGGDADVGEPQNQGLPRGPVTATSTKRPRPR